MPLSGLNSFKLIAKDLLIDSNSSINTGIMNFLSIDCSTDIGLLFVKIKSKTFTVNLQSDKYNNDLLMKNILIFLKKNNINFSNIDKIFVNQGPGNFSGLRGSIAIAKGIGIAQNIDIVGYNTFILMCASYLKKKKNIYSIIKFREKYFIKKFDSNLKSLSKIKEVHKADLLVKYKNKLIVTPNNLIKYIDKKILKINNLVAVDLDYNMLEFLGFEALLDKNLIKPIYLS